MSEHSLIRCDAPNCGAEIDATGDLAGWHMGSATDLAGDVDSAVVHGHTLAHLIDALKAKLGV